MAPQPTEAKDRADGFIKGWQDSSRPDADRPLMDRHLGDAHPTIPHYLLNRRATVRQSQPRMSTIANAPAADTVAAAANPIS
jgi:hypothetical protein